jgi:hypothetical protein
MMLPSGRWMDGDRKVGEPASVGRGTLAFTEGVGVVTVGRWMVRGTDDAPELL